jgi:integrase
VELRRRRMNAPSGKLLRGAAEEWLQAARAGIVRTRSGDPYKPSAIRGYEFDLKRRVLPELGHLRLSAVTRNRIQDLVEKLISEGFAPSTVGNAVLPLRAIYRRAEERGEVVANPTLNLRLPANRRRRQRVARPAEVAALLAALPAEHRALWATAIYAGLRRGELQALRWPSLDLERGLIRVEASWDRVAGLVSPKSRSGERAVPIPGVLRAQLVRHRLRLGGGGEGFVFEGRAGRPIDAEAATRRARRAWTKVGLSPLTLHECRHTYAALMIAAGVNAKALSTYMGHSSITVTLDRYGHLMPGAEREAAGMLDRYLERSASGEAAGAKPPRVALVRP